MIIATGAEAEIHKLNETTLKKVRPKKSYRIEEIDTRLRKFRNRREFKVLTKLYESKVNVPKPFKIFEKDEISFTFEFIDGKTLKSCLNQELLKKAFDQIIEMHNFGVTHSDLTTLNMLNKDDEIYIIDFGLAEFTTKAENRAVDLNLFFKCLQNEHPDFFNQKENLIAKYCKQTNFGFEVVKSLDSIEHRGRNKNK